MEGFSIVDRVMTVVATADSIKEAHEDVDMAMVTDDGTQVFSSCVARAVVQVVSAHDVLQDGDMKDYRGDIGMRHSISCSQMVQNGRTIQVRSRQASDISAVSVVVRLPLIMLITARRRVCSKNEEADDDSKTVMLPARVAAFQAVVDKTVVTIIITTAKDSGNVKEPIFFF